jgi:peptidoglycan hydrolase-like protein with peptidoglycan-binding domain
MKNKTIYILLVIIFTIGSPLVTQNIAAADTVSDLRLQLQTVLNRIEELKKELVLVESGVTSSSGGASCVSLSQNLSKGMENSEVQKLQVFLAQDSAIYPEGITSGYFGGLTELAVQRWQARYGVVSYGTPATTGYGSVGPKTRSAMNTSCNSNSGTASGADNVVSFTLSTSSGQAPIRTSANITMLEAACMSYKIDWGDGTPPTERTVGQTTNCGGGASTRSEAHTYAMAGTYTAKLYAGKGDIASLPQVTTTSMRVLEGQPFVQILSPNGGNTLRLGDTATIKWQVANQPEDSAVVFYMVGPNGTYRFAKRSHTTQEFNWIVGDRVCDGNGCNVQLAPGNNYKIRAALYTPANACIDFCDSDSITPKFLTNDDSDTTFAISQLGNSGSNPLSVLQKTGKAPFTAAMTVRIAPISTGAGNFEVDFGDGTTPYRVHIPAGETRVTERTISHTYSTTGDYYVRLRPVGAVQHIAEERMSVLEPTFTVSPSSQVIAPVTVLASFNKDTTCSHLGDVTRVYTVDWGDNTEDSRYEARINACSSTGAGAQSLSAHTFTHEYLSSGTYYPELIVSTGDTYYRQVAPVTISRPDLTVSPSFGFSPLTTKASFSVDDSCVMEEGTTISYSIDWGDGTAKTEYDKSLSVCNGTFSPSTLDKEYTHTYQEIGRYTVTLTVRKGNISTSTTRSQEVVVDRSVLRNGLRTVVARIDNLDIGKNMAAAVQSLFNTQ